MVGQTQSAPGQSPDPQKPQPVVKLHNTASVSYQQYLGTQADEDEIAEQSYRRGGRTVARRTPQHRREPTHAPTTRAAPATTTIACEEIDAQIVREGNSWHRYRVFKATLGTGYSGPLRLEDIASQCCDGVRGTRSQGPGTQADDAKSFDMTVKANGDRIAANKDRPGRSLVQPGETIVVFCYEGSTPEPLVVVPPPCTCVQRLIFHYYRQYKDLINRLHSKDFLDGVAPSSQELFEKAASEEAGKAQTRLTAALEWAALLGHLAQRAEEGGDPSDIELVMNRARKRALIMGVDLDCKYLPPEPPEYEFAISELEHLERLTAGAVNNTADEIRNSMNKWEHKLEKALAIKAKEAFARYKRGLDALKGQRDPDKRPLHKAWQEATGYELMHKLASQANVLRSVFPHDKSMRQLADKLMDFVSNQSSPLALPMTPMSEFGFWNSPGGNKHNTYDTTLAVALKEMGVGGSFAPHLSELEMWAKRQGLDAPDLPPSLGADFAKFADAQSYLVEDALAKIEGGDGFFKMVREAWNKLRPSNYVGDDSHWLLQEMVKPVADLWALGSTAIGIGEFLETAITDPKALIDGLAEQWIERYEQAQLLGGSDVDAGIKATLLFVSDMVGTTQIWETRHGRHHNHSAGHWRRQRKRRWVRGIARSGHRAARARNRRTGAAPLENRLHTVGLVLEPVRR